jgi:hypothetical protein
LSTPEAATYRNPGLHFRPACGFVAEMDPGTTVRITDEPAAPARRPAIGSQEITAPVAFSEMLGQEAQPAVPDGLAALPEGHAVQPVADTAFGF